MPKIKKEKGKKRVNIPTLIVAIFIGFFFLIIFFFEKQTHTHIREMEKSSNTKTHHNFTQKSL